MMAEKQPGDFSLPEAQPFLFDGDGHGVLLIHGISGSCAHMRLLGEDLHKRGFTVRGINLPGHAESLEAMSLTGWKDWLNGARKAVRELQESCERVSVCGLSMGGLIALILAAEMPLTACIPISAPAADEAAWKRFAPLMSIFRKYTDFNDPPETVSKLDLRYDQGYLGMPTKCMADLNRLISMAKASLPHITCPVLIVQSHGDIVIGKDSADIIMDGLSSPMKHTFWLDDAPHVCTISKEHDRIASEITKLLRTAETVRPYNEKG